MNSIKTRIPHQTHFDTHKNELENFHEPSLEMKKLIQFLQTRPSMSFPDKLRTQVYIPKVNNFNQINQHAQQTASPNKTVIFPKSKGKKQQKLTSFLNKTAFKQRKGFFSPKPTKVFNQISETPNPNFISLELSKQHMKSLKTPFGFRNIQLASKQLVQSQSVINYRNTIRECPVFLKKNSKSIKNIDNQVKIKIEDFTIFKTLGQGTFGEVFAAIHKQTEFICTIKRYKKEIIKSHELQDKFIHDIKVQMKMSHPHIVKLYGFFNDIAYFYMIFEYMESGNLAKTIQQKGGKLTEVEIFRKIFEINDALLYLHDKKIIHRDIKPASVLTCLNVCKLCDTEWIQENINSSQHITLCNELDYMPPQAIQGKQITPEFDVWGLGLIAFELLKGKKMIEGNTQKLLIRKIISLRKQLIQIMLPKECSENLKSFILSSLEPIPSKRLKSFEINKMKLQKQKEPIKKCIIKKSFSMTQRAIGFSQKQILPERKRSRRQFSIFGVKKEIKSEFSTFL